MSTSSNSHLVRMNSDQKMADGFREILSGIAVLPLSNQMMTPEQIARIFDDRTASTQNVQTTTAAMRAAVKSNRDKRAQTASLAAAAKRMVQAMFAEAPDTLAKFGLTPPKVGKRTVAAQAMAVLKNKATRQARHTMGKRQKEAIKGTVPAADLEVLESA